MKKLWRIVVLVAPLVSVAISKAVSASKPFDPSCMIAETDPPLYFEQATVQDDPAYRNLEVRDYKSVHFVLKTHRNSTRLEAWVNGKFRAATYYELNRDPPETDTLRLVVTNPSGERVEAQCYKMDAYFNDSSKTGTQNPIVNLN